MSSWPKNPAAGLKLQKSAAGARPDFQPLPSRATPCQFPANTAVSNRPPVPVVCALLAAQGRVLLAQRPAHKHLGLKWEFPGGKIEPDESPAAAIQRELHEELHCTVEVVRALPPFNHDYGAVVITLHPFVCRLAAGSPPPTPLEHVAVAWVRPDEIDAYDLAPADVPLLADLATHLASSEVNR